MSTVTDIHNSYLLPVNGRFLWFTTYPDIRQYSHWSLHVIWPQKHRYSRWNVVAIMHRSLDIPCTNVDTCISGLTAAILNFWVILACVTINKNLLEFTQQKTWHTTLFYSAISRISRLFTTCYHMMHAFISSRLDYCNVLHCGIAEGLMSRLQSV